MTLFQIYGTFKSFWNAIWFNNISTSFVTTNRVNLYKRNQKWGFLVICNLTKRNRSILYKIYASFCLFCYSFYFQRIRYVETRIKKAIKFANAPGFSTAHLCAKDVPFSRVKLFLITHYDNGMRTQSTKVCDTPWDSFCAVLPEWYIKNPTFSKSCLFAGALNLQSIARFSNLYWNLTMRWIFLKKVSLLNH